MKAKIKTNVLLFILGAEWHLGFGWQLSPGRFICKLCPQRPHSGAAPILSNIIQSIPIVCITQRRGKKTLCGNNFEELQCQPDRLCS